MANVKASAVLARVAYVKERFGDAGYERVVSELDPPFRDRLGKLILPQEWLPLDWMISLIDVTDRVHGRGDGALCREMARYAAEANLTTLYKIFFRITSVAFILGKAKALWNVNYDSGGLEIDELGKNKLALRIVGVDKPHCTHCRSVFAWAERSVELSGGKHVAVSVQDCRQRGARACQCTVTFQ